ncbi:uncharacterized protein DUF2480 [Winogradskyella epiphytica]|uniref:Uncharacterized protein DUF2480 n=1 Tax=Winogradskyella epiphytica TaxID=262005 RepID=A0A2V4Y3F5_9FLAO|nr:DUF2480 family protein [Winogradskyella epiphytica]PYE83414.1 uncharacterized protein DUF2480 [Winogradskyella epiphytica]GGW57986.1 hypothetical protein GCM10008085_07070 [Winogradskyella epiphytica]
MADEIINRVANSKLKVVDLEDYYPAGNRILFDIKDWLMEGLVLREKDFRAQVAAHDWSQYQDCYVALYCSTDAIVPDWAYMLISMELQDYAKLTITGSLVDLESIIYTSIISELDLEVYRDLPVIIKGCSHKPVPANALVLLSQKLKPIAKSIMFGEACSSVPLYKRR